MKAVGYVLKAIKELTDKGLPSGRTAIQKVIYLSLSVDERMKYYRPYFYGPLNRRNTIPIRSVVWEIAGYRLVVSHLLNYVFFILKMRFEEFSSTITCSCHHYDRFVISIQHIKPIPIFWPSIFSYSFTYTWTVHFKKYDFPTCFFVRK